MQHIHKNILLKILNKLTYARHTMIIIDTCMYNPYTYVAGTLPGSACIHIAMVGHLQRIGDMRFVGLEDVVHNCTR